ncbi:MAG TPA: SBBP repeat-containing protein, partial [Flavobacterium sp.]|nr:SBBP repeat-containing protein [Flavobacterium sp.]
MKHKLLFVYLFFSIFFCNSSKAQDFQWVRQFGDQGTDEAESIDVDNYGNSYSIGVAQSYTYDLDPTPNGT